MSISRRKARLWFTASLLLSTSAASAQHHQHGAALQEPESRAEHQLARAGAAAQAAGRHAEAITAFQAAQAISARRRYQALIALNEAALDHWVDAYRGLDESLRANDDPWIGRNETLLRSELARVRQHVAWVHLTGAPEGAAVRIDGAAAGTLPMSQDSLVAASQPLSIEVSAENFVSQQRTIDPPPGETVAVSVELTLRADENRDVAVHLEPPPPAVDPAPPRTATVREPLPLTPAAPPVASGLPTHFWVGIGITAGSAIGAGAAGLINNSLVGSYNDECRGPTMAPASCVTLRSDRQDVIDVLAALTYSSIGIASLGLGVAFFWPESAGRRHATAVRPLLGLRSAGLEVVW